MQSVLCGPRVLHDGGRRAPLTECKGAAGKRVMAVMPGGFDEHASKMGIAGLGNRASRLLGPAGMLGGHQADKAHEARGGGKATGVAEFGGDGERREIVNAAKAAQARDAGFKRFE